MSALNRDECRTYPNGDSISGGRGLRVKYNSGNVAVCGIERPLGLLEEDLLAGDNTASVRGIVPGKTYWMIAAQAITAGAAVYPDAAGKVTDVDAGADSIGQALEAASGDGSLIPVLAGLPGVDYTTTTTTAAP